MAFIAPAGTPVSLTTFGLGLWRGLTQSQLDVDLAHRLAVHGGQRRGWLFSTGRAAMVIALQALRERCDDPNRTQVIVPAYTCYSVPASVIRAGLQPRLCDIDPATLSMSPQALAAFDFSKVLAIVTANLYGLPNALQEIETLARQHGVALLDDAAQALGARHAGRPVGGFGEVGLYSFDKGKNITSLEGGALIASDPSLAAAIDALHQPLPAASTAHTATTLVKLGIYSLALRPSLYDIVRRLPGLSLGQTRYEDDYPIRQYSRVLAGFSSTLLSRLDTLTQQRQRNAEALRSALRPLPTVQVIEPLPDSQPADARLPILAADPAQRAGMLDRLNAAGVGATTSYPCALCDVPEVARVLPVSDHDMPGARQVAAAIITLPTHPYCPSTLPATVVQALAEPSRGARTP